MSRRRTAKSSLASAAAISRKDMKSDRERRSSSTNAGWKPIITAAVITGLFSLANTLVNADAMKAAARSNADALVEVARMNLEATRAKSDATGVAVSDYALTKSGARVKIDVSADDGWGFTADLCGPSRGF
jgi:hypothetical protein